MEISYKFIIYEGSGGKVDHIQEFIDGVLYYKYAYGYFESCSSCVVVKRMRDGAVHRHPSISYEPKRISLIRDKVEKVFAKKEDSEPAPGTVTYVVWLRTKPYQACKKIGNAVVERYWVNGNERDELFTLKERLTPQERSSGKKARCILISTEIDNVEILK